MMLAIIGVVLYLNRMTGNSIMSFLVFVLPLPSIFYIAKYGLRQGLVLSGAILLFPILIGDFIALFYVATAVVVGIVYGYGVYKDKDNGWLIIATTIFTAISSFIEVYLLSAFVGIDFIGEMKAIVEVLVKQFQDSGAVNIPSNITVLVLSMIPMVLILTALASAFVTHVAAIVMLQRLKIKTRKMKPMSEWVIPVKVALIFSVGIFANIGLRYTDNETYQIILTNIYSLSAMVFCADAFIFLVIFAKVSNRRYLSILAILVFILQPFGIVIGLFDCFTDLRKRVLYNYAKSLR